jgi:hypothetical protein
MSIKHSPARHACVRLGAPIRCTGPAAREPLRVLGVQPIDYLEVPTTLQPDPLWPPRALDAATPLV